MSIRCRSLKFFFALSLSNIVLLIVWIFSSGSTFIHISDKVPEPGSHVTDGNYEDQLHNLTQGAIHHNRTSKSYIGKLSRRVSDELFGENKLGTSQDANVGNKHSYDFHELRYITNKTSENIVTMNRGTGNILNPHDFRLIINEPDVCKDKRGNNKNVFLLVLILTVHANFEERKAIRETWGSPQSMDGRIIVSLFLLANTTDSTLQRQVEEESNKHRDIIMENFHDTYKNLTLKLIMGLKWMTNFCPQAKYILKADDDMYISYENIVKHLAETAIPSENYVVGYLIYGTPIRDVRSKWYMSKEMYPKLKYPPFCSGTSYAMSGDIASKVYTVSLQTPYLHLEDVFFSVCLEKLGIVPKGLEGFHHVRVPYSYCKFKRILTAHQYPAIEKRKIWRNLRDNANTPC